MNYCDENGCQNRKRELVEPQPLGLKLSESFKEDADNFIKKFEPETIEQAAEKFYPLKTAVLICAPKLVRDGFINGAKSEAAKNYWFNKFKEEQK